MRPADESTPDQQRTGLDVDDVVGLTAALAAIDSINPTLVPGAPGERDVADFVADWGAVRGFEVHRSEAAPGRPNVVLVRRGSGGGRSLLFNGHMDTVGTRGARTKDVIEHDGRLFGRGVLDTKGGLAAALVAAAAFADGQLQGDLIVAAVADEEGGCVGTEALVKDWRPDAAVVLEPTDLTVIPRHRGFAVIDVQLQGKPAHTSRADRGANAVHAAAAVTAAVQAVDAGWVQLHDDPVERPTTLVNRIVSEGEMFTVPSVCQMLVELRTTGEFPHLQVQEVIAAIRAASPLVTECTVIMNRHPLAQHDEHPLVTALQRAAVEAGGHATLAVAPYWTDAALHSGAGTPAVVYGPTGEGLHEDEEWVTIESLHQCAATLRALAEDWCGTTGHPA